MTDHTDLCKRLQVVADDRSMTDYGAAGIMHEAAAAIEALEADNAALRQRLKNEKELLEITIVNHGDALNELGEAERRIESLEADNAALRSENARLLQLVLSPGTIPFNWKELEADNAALRQDALRYRWLRRHNPQWVGFAMHESTFSRVDADVDAAMREGKK